MLCYLCASSWRARMWYELLMSQFELSDICLIFFSWIKYCIISCCEYLIFMYLVCPSLTSLFIWYSWYLHHRQPCVVFTPPPTMSDIYTTSHHVWHLHQHHVFRTCWHHLQYTTNTQNDFNTVPLILHTSWCWSHVPQRNVIKLHKKPEGSIKG